MLIIFFFFSFQKSIRVNKIENSNTSIYLILPTNSQNIFSVFYQNMINFLQSNFSSISMQNITYSDWMDKYNIKISSDKIYLALFRFNQFVEIYPGQIELDCLRKYLTLALSSHVIIIHKKDLPIILNTQKRFFILQNDHIYYEYENAAFLYKYSKITFYFIEGSFSLVYYDNINQCSRKYDFSRSMTIFIKSCAYINKKTIKKFKKIQFENIQKVNHQIQRFHLFAITNLTENKNEINQFFSNLKSLYYQNGNFSIIDWQNGYSSIIQKNCKISPNKITYAITYSKNGNDFCYFYPYKNILNQDNFDKFFESRISSFFLTNFLIGNNKKPKFSFESANNNLSKIIPDSKSAIIAFMPNSKSTSNNRAYEIYFLLKFRLKFLKGIKFIEINSTKNSEDLPYFIPFNDGFPMFVMWEKDNRRPHVFKGELTNNNILDFALKYIPKNKM